MSLVEFTAARPVGKDTPAAYMTNAWLAACVFALATHFVVDVLLFELQSSRSRVFVGLLEAAIQLVAYRIAVCNPRNGAGHSQTRAALLFLLLNVIAFSHKLLFLQTLASTPVVDSFFTVLPFAVGPAYSLAPIADASIDVIAKSLYQCGLCLRHEEIPLNEPFIAYFYVAISFMAGEFNQRILWLTLHAANFGTAWVLLKTVSKFFPSIQFVWLVPVLSLGLFDAHAATLTLFKDGLVALLLVCLLYLNLHVCAQKTLPPAFVVLSMLTIAALYSFRSGMLALVVALSIMNMLFHRKAWKLHAGVLIGALFLTVALGSVFKVSGDLYSSWVRTTDKLVHGTAKHLDVQNIRYTTTRDESVLTRLNLHDLSPSNFYYMPIVKGALYFVLPFPSTSKAVSHADWLYKLSSAAFFVMLPLLAFGVGHILKHRRREELYLLLAFGLCVLLIVGAGPFILPRYRIMAAPFFLLIAALGASFMPRQLRNWCLGVSCTALAVLLLGYQELQGLLRAALT
jgi:hypothetical protein